MQVAVEEVVVQQQVVGQVFVGSVTRLACQIVTSCDEDLAMGEGTPMRASCV